ncbi:MAG: hypothetical protein AAF492_31835, partial [Verrucomicrobiota bacterium]
MPVGLALLVTIGATLLRPWLLLPTMIVCFAGFFGWQYWSQNAQARLAETKTREDAEQTSFDWTPVGLELIRMKEANEAMEEALPVAVLEEVDAP